jgi:maleylpyruvate isomerase
MAAPPGGTAVKLYSYFRSSAAYRVRIALHLKGLPFDYVPVHLLRAGGEQFTAEFRMVSPQAQVPVLEDDGAALTQSLAIIEYLDECHPAVPLLPREPLQRARVRALALTIACDIHPLNNLRVTRYLANRFAIDEEGRTAWMRHWIALGLDGFEATLAAGGGARGRYCCGSTPTLADCCLIPQLFNARRVGLDTAAWPRAAAIDAACQELDGFRRAHPELQPDFERA